MGAPGPVALAYAGCRERIAAIAGELTHAAAASTRVPTCPQWSVHDVVAHVTGVVDDALAGRLDGVATEPWTAAQVEARRGVPIADVIAEWNEKAPTFESMLDAIGDPGRQAVLDVLSHEHDIRAALGRPGARDSDAVRVGLSFIGPAFVAAAGASGLAVRVESTEGDSFGADSADADARVRGSAFDLVRSVSGRRTVDEVRSALQWEGDVARAVAALTYGPFVPPASPVDA